MLKKISLKSQYCSVLFHLPKDAIDKKQILFMARVKEMDPISLFRFMSYIVPHVMLKKYSHLKVNIVPFHCISEPEKTTPTQSTWNR